jgi:hypothetical protein
MQHQLSVSLNVLIEEMRILEVRKEDEEPRGRDQNEITMNAANIDVLMEAIERVRDAYKVSSDSSLDYTW